MPIDLVAVVTAACALFVAVLAFWRSGAPRVVRPRLWVKVRFGTSSGGATSRVLLHVVNAGPVAAYIKGVTATKWGFRHAVQNAFDVIHPTSITSWIETPDLPHRLDVGEMVEIVLHASGGERFLDEYKWIDRIGVRPTVGRISWAPLFDFRQTRQWLEIAREQEVREREHGSATAAD